MRGTVLGAVTALVLTAIPATAATAAPAGPQEKPVDEITLVTGDKVLLGHDGRIASIKPGEGRDHIKFRTHRGHDKHVLVIPSDAIEPLAADRLDRRLFDITLLQEFGYRDRMPLIVDGQARMSARSAGEWTALKNDTSSKVWLDGIRKPSLDRSVAQIGAPVAHQRGITGQGVKVGVVDTGVDQNHPDLKGREFAERNFTSDPDNTDLIGHGTHVGATIASNGAKYGGVAPGAQLLDAKVCGRQGCQESWILAGMRWAAEQGAQVVNMSLGGLDTPEIDPLEEAVNTLTAQHGTLFVVAAGNSGGAGTVSSPSTADAALSVGAVERDDKLAFFSSKGPRAGDSGLKPDVTAPGVGIVAAESGTTGHFAASGTSMATPHVAGAAALLKQQHPDWTPAQIKAVLATTAKPTAGTSAFDQGAGRIDLAKAIDQKVSADVVSVNLGLQQWPHDDDKPVTKSYNYLNTTDAAITFDLKLNSSAPAGLFTLSASKVTVPAKGSASVSVTGDTRAGTKDTVYSGEIVATSGTHTVRTLVGIDREVESYDVAIDYSDRDGKDPANSLTFIIGLDQPTRKIVVGTGDQKVRLPKGRYLLDGTVTVGERDMDVLISPTVNVTGNLKTALDMRLTQAVSVTAPEPLAAFTPAEIVYQRLTSGGMVSLGMVAFDGFGSMRTGQAGGPLSPKEMSSLVALHALSAADQAVGYRLAYQIPGTMPNGLTRAPAKKDLARVTHKLFERQPGDKWTTHGMIPTTELGVGGGALVSGIPDGSDAVEYLTGEDMVWQSITGVTRANGSTVGVISGNRRYVEGKSYTEIELKPVFSPGLPPSPFPYAARTGNDIFVAAPMLADASHGEGSSSFDKARTALYRDGVLVGETAVPGGSFPNLPAAEASYRAEISLDRSAQFELSTTVSAVWTFRSKAEERAALPMSVVRFEPKLNAQGAVREGTLQRVKLLTQSQGAAGELRDVKVEFSFDDGKSWRRAAVSGDNALMYHPVGASHASVRASATDTKGNTVELTVIRAYRITGQ